MSSSAPNILVFDSGLGGLTVFEPIKRARPDAHFIYAADNALFPYGDIAEDALLARVAAVFDAAITRFKPDLVVIACHTASTLVLPMLRARFSVPFVGTVPAIKPAAECSQTRRIGILSTHGTAKRDYTAGLIAEFAKGCDVILHAPTQLARRAEAALAGEKINDADLLADIAPCFVDEGGRRTDTIVLACTHYPLLLDALKRVAPWPVTWIDPAPAIARRVTHLLGYTPDSYALPPPHRAVFTTEPHLTPALHVALERHGLTKIETLTVA